MSQNKKCINKWIWMNFTCHSRTRCVCFNDDSKLFLRKIAIYLRLIEVDDLYLMFCITKRRWSPNCVRFENGIHRAFALMHLFFLRITFYFNLLTVNVRLNIVLVFFCIDLWFFNCDIQYKCFVFLLYTMFYFY